MAQPGSHRRQISYSIFWLLGRVHVATSYGDVAADIAERSDRAGLDRVTRARLVTSALVQHRRNRAEYAWVMGSH